MKVFRAEVDFTVSTVFEMVAADEAGALNALQCAPTSHWVEAMRLALAAGTYDVDEDTVDFEDMGEAEGFALEGDVRAVMP